MLLRSITKHVREQNWFAVFIDFIIVVVGVFIGIQVANWNEERGNRLEEHATLIALKSDVIESKSNIIEFQQSISQGQSHLKLLAEFSDGQHDDLTIAQIDEHILRGLYTIYGTTTHMVTYQELVNTGRIKLISDNDLRNTLKVLFEQMMELEEEESSIIKMSYETLDPYLLNHLEFRGFIGISSATYKNLKIDWLDANTGRSDPKATLRNTKFQNFVLYRARLNLVQMTLAERVKGTMEDVESRIDEELTKRYH